MGNEGTLQGDRSLNLNSSYIPNNNLGSTTGGGTYTSGHTEPTVADFENVFGPTARNMKDDTQRYKRHGRWHLPDILKGPNPWLADRIDGLITDATNSPFTSTILPYKYFENVDGKLKWNVWSFDEAMASRVPYESAARTLTQTKSSFSAYAVRHGLAITLEHNFMMTPQGRKNFQDQLTQLVGSIQYSNDFDVHMALIQAPSYEKKMIEKYNNYNKSPMQSCREFIDLFGFMQKNPNALDILIEEAKLKLKTWGGPMPNFMLTNSKLTFQLTMTPERTNYISQGPDGIKRLKQGPDMASYRGVSIIPSRSFSLETGQPPRDVMRRRVRVAEYYRITPDAANVDRLFEFYNEERDTFFTLTFKDLVKMGVNDDSDDANHERANFAILHKQITNKKTPSRTIDKHISSINDWYDLCGQIGATGSNGIAKTVVVPSDKYVASWVNNDTVFVPFVGNLHFDKDQKVTVTAKNKNIPDHIANALCNSVATYPRQIKHSHGKTKGLRNPFTMETVDQNSADYHETSIALNRLCQRYAAPTSYLMKIGNDKLGINVQAIKNKDKMHVGDMFYQPLGAFMEPNHPLFHEALLHGKCKNVHESWILTEEVLDHLYNQPEKWQEAASIAASISGKDMSHAQYSLAVAAEIEKQFAAKGTPARNGLTNSLKAYTWGVHDDYITSQDYLNPASELGEKFHARLKQHAPRGIVTNAYLQKLVEMGSGSDAKKHPWLLPSHTDGSALTSTVQKVLADRLTKDAYDQFKNNLQESMVVERLTSQLLAHDFTDSIYKHSDFSTPMGTCDSDMKLEAPNAQQLARLPDRDAQMRALAPFIEFVIIRPNIEHYMLGIILGESGDSLGNTLWGQTELAVHDDSQHGVWGMQYKYHEKAIVFNEKNLIRLWDIAYDGYNGGKDDSYVRWSDEDDTQRFREDTLDVTKDYHGKSMMVMMFVHEDDFQQHPEWRTNWPSPIMFYDRGNGQADDAVPDGPENQAFMPTKDFQVFDRDLYPTYQEYFDIMPNFTDLHKTRKSASESVEENETQTGCLAFQGTMRVKNANGSIIDTINGSGHHGADYVGVSSVRAGKGYKLPNGISSFIRQV